MPIYPKMPKFGTNVEKRLKFAFRNHGSGDSERDIVPPVGLGNNFYMLLYGGSSMELN